MQPAPLFRPRHPVSASMMPLLWVIAVTCGCVPSLSRAAAPVTATRATLAPDSTWNQGTGCGNSDEKKVIVGRAHDGDYSVRPEFLCATLSYNGILATLKMEPPIELPEARHALIAPLNQFITGQVLRGDENGISTYSLSSATVSTGETLYVKPEGGWTAVKESNHRFTCPKDTVLIARTHVGDENETTYYACGSLWGQSAPLPPVGQIVFYHHETNVPCSVDVPSAASGTTWTYPFRAHDARCVENAVRGLQLDSVQSAVRILLTDDDLCQKNDNFWILLRTTAKSTTVSPELKIADIFTYPKGSIIRPGLQLVDYHLKPGADTTRHLSCVQITSSATPPAP